MSVDRHEGSACGCCGRNATGFGYAPPRNGSRPIWVCDDPECLQLAKDSYSMRQDHFDRIEALAAVRAAEQMGRRLEELGRGSAFEGMQWEEWLEVTREGIASYRSALKTELKDEAPF